MAKLANAAVSNTAGQLPYGFESRYPHRENGQNHFIVAYVHPPCPGTYLLSAAMVSLSFRYGHKGAPDK